jgi:hypothetical protein
MIQDEQPDRHKAEADEGFEAGHACVRLFAAITSAWRAVAEVERVTLVLRSSSICAFAWLSFAFRAVSRCVNSCGQMRTDQEKVNRRYCSLKNMIHQSGISRLLPARPKKNIFASTDSRCRLGVTMRCPTKCGSAHLEHIDLLQVGLHFEQYFPSSMSVTYISTLVCYLCNHKRPATPSRKKATAMSGE